MKALADRSRRRPQQAARAVPDVDGRRRTAGRRARHGRRRHHPPGRRHQRHRRLCRLPAIDARSGDRLARRLRPGDAPDRCRPLGGIDKVLDQPAIRQTPAGRAGKVLQFDTLLLLGFGPRTPQAATELPPRCIRNWPARRDGAGAFTRDPSRSSPSPPSPASSAACASAPFRSGSRTSSRRSAVDAADRRHDVGVLYAIRAPRVLAAFCRRRGTGRGWSSLAEPVQKSPGRSRPARRVERCRPRRRFGDRAGREGDARRPARPAALAAAGRCLPRRPCVDHGRLPHGRARGRHPGRHAPARRHRHQRADLGRHRHAGVRRRRSAAAHPDLLDHGRLRRRDLGGDPARAADAGHLRARRCCPPHICSTPWR